MTDEEVVELMSVYIIKQINLGRNHIMESELYTAFGSNFPTDIPDRKFILKEYENVINMADFKARYRKH